MTVDRDTINAAVRSGRDAMDLSLMGHEARQNSERWFPELHASQDMAAYYCLALAGESGELCNLLKKYVRNDHVWPPGIREELPGELADIFTYLLLLADELKIDLLTAFEAKQAECEQRWGTPSPT